MISAKAFKNLAVGDIVTNDPEGKAYTVLGHVNETVIAIRYITVTNPSEWTIFRKHQAHTVIQLHENRIKQLEKDKAIMMKTNSDLHAALDKALNK